MDHVSLHPRQIEVSRRRNVLIRLIIDEDVLNYFKKQGAGYQRRMNAVLRSFVEQKRKPTARPKKRA